MINPTALNIVSGWSVGYQYAFAKSKEDEVKQGKNYLMAGGCQAAQLMHLGTIISRLADKVLSNQMRITTKILCNIVPLLAFPLIALMASVKQGCYNKFQTTWNTYIYPYIPIKLPEELNGRFIAACKFFAEHGGNIFRVAMVAATAGLLFLEDYAYACATLSALAYQAVDTLGWVPRKISLFLETYLYNLSIIGYMIDGTVLARLILALQLPLLLSSSIKNYVCNKFDNLIHHKFNVPGPTLEETFAEVIERRDMAFNDIMKVLKAETIGFEVIPSHCTKWAADLADLPTDTDFTKLQSLFDEIDWAPRAAIIKGKLQDDDRFIDYLSEQFPDTKKDDLKIDIEPSLKKLAEKEGQGATADTIAIEWTRKQVAILIQVLNGKKRVKGTQKDLDDGITNMSKVLPYLLELKAKNKTVDLEDGLLKIAIEGGDYCGRQIKRSSDELVRSCVHAQLEQSDGHDPIKDYELVLKQTLQDKRTQGVEFIYKLIVDSMKVPGEISKDVHGYDVYRTLLALGFIPLTKHEMGQIALLEIGTWAMYGVFREKMFEAYKFVFDSAITEIGENKFADFMRNLILTNKTLTDNQKEEIIEVYTSRNNGEWSVQTTNLKFHRLMYVMLGILKQKDA